MAKQVWRLAIPSYALVWFFSTALFTTHIAGAHKCCFCPLVRPALEGGVGKGEVWGPKVCVPNMAQRNLSFRKCHFFPTLTNLGVHPCPKKYSNSGLLGRLKFLRLYHRMWGIFIWRGRGGLWAHFPDPMPLQKGARDEGPGLAGRRQGPSTEFGRGAGGCPQHT